MTCAKTLLVLLALSICVLGYNPLYGSGILRIYRSTKFYDESRVVDRCVSSPQWFNPDNLEWMPYSTECTRYDAKVTFPHPPVAAPLHDWQWVLQENDAELSPPPGDDLLVLTTRLSAYLAFSSTFGPGSYNITASPVLAAGWDGCGDSALMVSLVGKIAVLGRGSCSFLQKVCNAQYMGAIAVIHTDFRENASTRAGCQDADRQLHHCTDAKIPSIFLRRGAVFDVLSRSEGSSITISSARSNGVLVKKEGEE
jgi:hypothetical protein